MPSAPLESREHLLADYACVRAIERVWWTLTTGMNGLHTVDGPPLCRFEDEAELLDRLHQEDVYETLWPNDWELDDEPADYREAWQKADLKAAQMLIALAGASEFCAKAAQRLLERSGVVPKPELDDEVDDA